MVALAHLAADRHAEVTRDERVAELVDQDGGERETDDEQPECSAEREEPNREQDDEARVDLDGEAEEATQSP